MVDEQQNTGGNNTATNNEIKTTGDMFEATREYKQTKDVLAALEAQEVIFESVQHDAQAEQEKQEKQRAFADNGIEIDPNTGNYVIRINTSVDPELQAKLDPNSPQFDPALYKEHTTAAMQQLQSLLEQMHNTLLNMQKASLNPDAIQKITNSIQKNIAALAKTITNEVINGYLNYLEETMYYIIARHNKAIQENLAKIMPFIAKHNKVIQEHLEKLEQQKEWEQLEPFITAELKKPEYKGATLDELIELDNGKEDSSLFDKAVTAAQAALLASTPKTATIKRANIIELPLDKVNTKIWNLLKKNTCGQLAFALEKRGSKQEITALYSIDFDEALSEGVKITKKLLPFDKRVYIAVNALFNAGNNVITLTQVYYAMGYNGKPGTRDLQKIRDSIVKMQAAQIVIDNSQEATAYKKTSNNWFIKYTGSLLPMEAAELYSVNGKLTDAAIHIFREPPLISFAKKRNQLTTVEIKLLQSPVNKTDNNLLIDDYLLERISRMKNGRSKSSSKILYQTIFDNCGIETSKQKSRAKDTIKRYLEHYKSCDLFKSYTAAADGITIQF